MTDKEIKATQLQFSRKMKGFNYSKWVNDKKNQYFLNLSFSGVSHIAKGLEDLTAVYTGELLSSPFLRGIMIDSLISAFACADAINMQGMAVYADFVYNMVPIDLRVNKKELYL